MVDEKYTLEQLLTGHFIKYNRLSELIGASYAGSNCTKINLFIDLNSLVKGLYSIDAWGYKSVSRYEMTAIILNMCGHYRQFFRNLGVSTNIYLIYGLNCPKSNETYVFGYNNSFVRPSDLLGLYGKSNIEIHSLNVLMLIPHSFAMSFASRSFAIYSL